MIYADNAATTRLDTDAFEAMRPFLLEEYANVSGSSVECVGRKIRYGQHLPERGASPS